jgi:hypothetical protein
MRARRGVVASVIARLTFVGVSMVAAGQSVGPLPLEPLGVRGEAVFPALEGWYPNADGTFTILLGYYNRNTAQTLDIPIGPDNRIEPGGPDRGQPTHFLPRRQYGVFSITVPKNFGNTKLTWTLVANGQPSVVTFWLNPPYLVEPFKNLANGNTPPVLRLVPGKPELQGPPRGVAASLTTKAAEPLTLALEFGDKPPTYVPPPSPAAVARGRGGRGGPPPVVTITWTKFRGPGDVTFTEAKHESHTLEGRATTAMSFSAPGEYVIRATANDSSGDGGGGDQCCWTTALVKVTVEP